VALYDLQGRLVLRQQADSDGSGKDSVRLEFSGAQMALTPGIYFVIAQDGRGSRSDAKKVVILK
jgi:hypothetical protein